LKGWAFRPLAVGDLPTQELGKSEGVRRALVVSLGSSGQRIVYDPIPGEGEVFRVESDVREVPIKATTGDVVNTLEETDSTRISRVTVEQAIAEIRHHIPNFSGHSESEVRKVLQGMSKG
jgi:hypothetical protein